MSTGDDEVTEPVICPECMSQGHVWADVSDDPQCEVLTMITCPSCKGAREVRE